MTPTILSDQDKQALDCAIADLDALEKAINIFALMGRQIFFFSGESPEVVKNWDDVHQMIIGKLCEGRRLVVGVTLWDEFKDERFQHEWEKAVDADYDRVNADIRKRRNQPPTAGGHEV